MSGNSVQLMLQLFSGSRCSTSAVVWSLVGCFLMFQLYPLVHQNDRMGGEMQFRSTHHPQFHELEAVEEENIQIPPPRKRSPRAAKRKPRRPTTLIDEFLDENSQLDTYSFLARSML
ncbi:uncharacterized protein Pyn_19648 [Prunus yedoensis var. nudiflora]|uniref:Uncharacterized protein n=1 Tax=Prunus yedoensis var. nudiflora TaxID=2094558 RepID=A0A314YEY4_PRUYE|nr:uncharacterized protein Pyn_19648 [Prunus yedoensis var. nudiflora]